MSSWSETKASNIYQSKGARLERIDKKDVSESDTLLTLLDTQVVVLVEGENAAKFLQGQCTSDIAALEIGQSTLGAFCNNKGRVFSNFRALKIEGGILLRMSADIAKETISQLEKYAVFFRATMTIWDTPSVAVANNISSEKLDDLLAGIPNGIYRAELENNTWEFYIAPNNAENFLDYFSNHIEFGDETDWYAAQISAGTANINSCTALTYLPHQLNMDKSGAVSFKKGCYTGQEIIARTEYRGQTKRRVFPVSFDTAAPDDIHFRLATPEAPDKIIEVLDSTEKDQKLLAAVLLPVDFPDTGSLLVDGKETTYQVGALPFSFD